MKKIFIIGFNKSGTVSLHNYFKKNGIPSVHWDRGALSETMFSNFESNKPLLSGYEEYTAYSDMEHFNRESLNYSYAGERFFKELKAQYPESVFILNHRQIDSWIQSRINHQYYLFNNMFSYKMSRQEVINFWRQRYTSHISDAREFFKDDSSFLDLPMTKESSSVLSDFLVRHGFNIADPIIDKIHKTKHSNDNDSLINSLRDLAIRFETFQTKTGSGIEIAHEIMDLCHKLRPEGPHIKKRLSFYKKYLSESAPQGQ